MATNTAGVTDLKSLVGKAIDDLSLTERLELANTWVAFRVYRPTEKITKDGIEYVDVRLKRIAAAGKSVEELISQLSASGLDPKEYEFTPLKPPY